jgi:hypothetical protein
MFDEISDVQMQSFLDLFMNVLFTDGTFQTITLTLSELDANNTDTVYNKLVEVLTENNVDIQFIMGICSDGCSVMLRYAYIFQGSSSETSTPAANCSNPVFPPAPSYLLLSPQPVYSPSLLNPFPLPG